MFSAIKNKFYKKEIISGRNYLDFVVIGSAKCGTTSLHNYLNMHCNIQLVSGCGINKENAIFLDFNSERVKGISNRYLRRYVTRDKIYARIIEARTQNRECKIGIESTDYTKRPDRNVRFDLMMESMQFPKIIFIARNPFEKLISQFEHFRRHRKYWTKDDFYQEVSSFDYYKNSASYYYQLEPYLKIFGKESIFITCVERMKEDPAKVMGEICDFMEISHYNGKEEFGEIYNKRPNNDGRNEYRVPDDIQRAIIADVQKFKKIADFEVSSYWKL